VNIVAVCLSMLLLMAALAFALFIFLGGVFYWIEHFQAWRTGKPRQNLFNYQIGDEEPTIDYAGVHRAANEAFKREAQKIIARQRAEHPELWGDTA